MRFLTLLSYLLLCVLLTIVTQIGGVVFILCWLLYRFFIVQKTAHIQQKFLLKISTFVTGYLLATFLIVPFVAPIFGRVALPIFLHKNIRPVNMLTCVLNRNYVRPALKKAVEDVAEQLKTVYPDTEIQYLDANMPFLDGFPLIPHLSHSDGRKLDIAFFYTNTHTALPTNGKPAWSGYGVFAGPEAGERDRIKECRAQGYWLYDKAKYMSFWKNEADFVLEKDRTRKMTQLFAAHRSIEKMFIEPHLQSRLHLEKEPKIRLHGCKAVRHDDHLHIQIKR
jgi:hypothetical protein